MSNKDKEIFKILAMFFRAMTDVIAIAIFMVIFLYIVKAALGIDIFPGWSLIH